jgi:tetratricopeptide repeat protein 8
MQKGIAMILTEYLLHVEHNTRKALELCAEATKACDFKDWYWKARLGKCYFKLGGSFSPSSIRHPVISHSHKCTQLDLSFFNLYFRFYSTSYFINVAIGLFREAEKQFRSSLKIQPVVSTYLELCNVYIRLDMPNSALDLLEEASSKFTTDPRLVLGVARIYDMLHEPEKAMAHFKVVLSLDASNVEALASLGEYRNIIHSLYSLLNRYLTSHWCFFKVRITSTPINLSCQFAIIAACFRWEFRMQSC